MHTLLDLFSYPILISKYAFGDDAGHRNTYGTKQKFVSLVCRIRLKATAPSPYDLSCWWETHKCIHKPKHVPAKDMVCCYYAYATFKQSFLPFVLFILKLHASASRCTIRVANTASCNLIKAETFQIHFHAIVDRKIRE